MDILETIRKQNPNGATRHAPSWPPCTGLDLSGLDLTGLNFDGLDLVGVNFEGSDLSESTFRDADLTAAAMSTAVGRHVNLTGAILDHPSFKNFRKDTSVGGYRFG